MYYQGRFNECIRLNGLGVYNAMSIKCTSSYKICQMDSWMYNFLKIRYCFELYSCWILWREEGFKTRGPNITISLCDRLIAMKILSRLMEEATKNEKEFSFHPRCSEIKLTHLCFADDLLLFSLAKMQSVQIIKKCYKSLMICQDWKQIQKKSTFYCSGVSQLMKEQTDCLKMKGGKLPVRYLEVPLISKKLSAAYCSMLMEKISRRIDSWMSKNLSFAGRLQLLSFVL